MKKLSKDAKRSILIFCVFIIGFFLVISFGCNLNFAAGDQGGVMEYIAAFFGVIFSAFGLYGFWNEVNEKWVKKEEKPWVEKEEKPKTEKKKAVKSKEAKK